MIKQELIIESLGITLDGNDVIDIDIKYDYKDTYYLDPSRPIPAGHTVTFRLKSGDTIMTRGKYTIKRTVEFELGATYIVSDGKSKWLAVCVESMNGELCLRAVKYTTAQRSIFADDPNRFDYTYEEILPDKKVKGLL